MYRFRILHPNAMTRLRLQPVMHGMIGILFLFNVIGVYKMADPNWIIAALFIVMGFASLLFPFMLRRVRKITETNSVLRMLQAFTMLSGCLFFLSHMQPVIGFTLFLAGLGVGYIGYAEYKILQPAYVTIDTTGISLPTVFGHRHHGWNEMKNVILRNDLLTLDYKNNKILQLEVLDEFGPVEAAEMNTFFQSRISS
ncbi:hypothetical protein [Chitinophaga barathri]|uniref:DUF5673 domain-containing protein n=1 Tax=Chitinophaga barathri TaxID=1647451 RepID=A0A3N4MUF7_9BACT|nr:hypothetical protein [Chitinophaga barathri]RPD43199.1 hypothetical protein EG028_02570 [Chitinophaga barathri]